MEREVIILKLDEPNFNGRTYSTEIAQSIMAQVDYHGGATFGELNPPVSDQSSSINLARVSHRVSNLRIEDGCLKGTLKILDTLMGKVAQDLYDHVELGVRPRGFGEVAADGTITHYNLVSFDLVSEPA